MTTADAPDLEAFFRAYATMMDDGVRTGRIDGEAVAAFFADAFVGAAPAGVAVGENKGLGATIDGAIEGYRAMGGTRFVAERIAIEELAPASAMATLDWRFDYDRDGRTGSIRFTNRYLVNSAGGTPKIFAWVTPDEQQALAEHGLI